MAEVVCFPTGEMTDLELEKKASRAWRRARRRADVRMAKQIMGERDWLRGADERTYRAIVALVADAIWEGRRDHIIEEERMMRELPGY